MEQISSLGFACSESAPDDSILQLIVATALGSRHRHILPPRRVLRRASLLLHAPVFALARAASGA